MSNIIVFLAVSFVVSLIGFTSVQFLVNQHKAVKEGRAVTNPQTPFIVIGAVGLFPYAGAYVIIKENIVTEHSECMTTVVFMSLYYATVTLLCLLWETSILGLRDLVIKALVSIGRYIRRKLDVFIDKNTQRTNNEDNNQQ